MLSKQCSQQVLGFLSILVWNGHGITLKPVDEKGIPYKELTEEDYYVDVDGNKKVKSVDYSVEEYDAGTHRYFDKVQYRHMHFKNKPVDYTIKESDSEKLRATKQVLGKVRDGCSVLEINKCRFAVSQSCKSCIGIPPCWGFRLSYFLSDAMAVQRALQAPILQRSISLVHKLRAESALRDPFRMKGFPKVSKAVAHYLFKSQTWTVGVNGAGALVAKQSDQEYPLSYADGKYEFTTTGNDTKWQAEASPDIFSECGSAPERLTWIGNDQSEFPDPVVWSKFDENTNNTVTHEILALMRNPHFDINYKYHIVYECAWTARYYVTTPLLYACAVSREQSDIMMAILKFRIENSDSRNLGIVLGRDGISKNRKRIFKKKTICNDTRAAEVLGNDSLVRLLYTFLRRPLLDIGTTDSFGMSVLYHAMSRSHLDIARFLLTSDFENFNGKLDVNAQCCNGFSVLHKLVDSCKDNDDIAKLLIASDGVNFREKIDVNLQTLHGETPLHKAIYEIDEKFEIAKLLVSHHGNNFKTKLDISIQDEFGTTCLDKAVQKDVDYDLDSSDEETNQIEQNIDEIVDLMIKHHLSVSISQDKSKATIGNNCVHQVQTKVCEIDFAKSAYPIDKIRPDITNAWGMMVAATELQEVVVHLLQPGGLAERSGLEKDDEVHALFVDGEQKWTSDRLVVELCRRSGNLRWAVERFDTGFSRFIDFIREACIEKQKIEFVVIPKAVFNAKMNQVLAKASVRLRSSVEIMGSAGKNSIEDSTPRQPQMEITADDAIILQEIQDAVHLPLEIVSKIYLETQKSKSLSIDRCLSGFSHFQVVFKKLQTGQEVELIRMECGGNGLVGTIIDEHATMQNTWRVQLVNTPSNVEIMKRLDEWVWQRRLVRDNFIVTVVGWRIKLISGIENAEPSWF